MKRSKIVYKTPEQVAKMKRIDLKSMPKKQAFYLKPVVWALSAPAYYSCKPKVTEINMEGLEKQPYLMLCNHASFIDFQIAGKYLFPRGTNYVSSADGCIGREWLMRQVGCIFTRKFVNDISLVRKMKYSLDTLKQVCVLYPEARYSIAGTGTPLPQSIGKMIKLFKVPVVTFILKGNFLRQPVWNTVPSRSMPYKRNLPIEIEIEQVITKEDAEKLSAEEISARLAPKFAYDDFAYQRDNKIKNNDPVRAKGLDKILYRCPHCGAVYQMDSDGTRLWCEKCKAEYYMNEYGQLEGKNVKTAFSHIPDWFEWERSFVREEIEKGEYLTEIDVDIEVLVNSKGLYRYGKGKFVHNMDGVYAYTDDKKWEFKRAALENNSFHVEYEFHQKGDTVSVSDADNTYFFFVKKKKGIITRLHFAAEELYRYHMEHRNQK